MATTFQLPTNPPAPATRQTAPRREPQATIVSRRTFLALEDSLAIPTFNAWKRDSSPIMQKIADAFERGDTARAFDMIQELDLAPVAERATRRARFIGMSAVLFGASEFGDPENTIFANGEVPEVVDRAVEIFKRTLVNTNQAVQRATRQFLTEKLQDKRTRKLQGTFAVDLAAKAQAAGGANVLLASSLHASRLGSWGFTMEAQARGVEFYKVSEQLDTRTCPVCRQMHNKVFSIPKAQEKLDRWLGTEDPNDLKQIATFPSQSKAGIRNLKAMNTDQLQGAGWDTPPYHPFCRGVLKKTRRQPEVGPGALNPGQVTSIRPGRSKLPLDQYAKQFDDADVTVASVMDDLSPSVRREIAENEANLLKLQTTDITHKRGGQWTPERQRLHQDILFGAPTRPGRPATPGIFTTEAIAGATPEAGVPHNLTMLGGRGGSGKGGLGKGPNRVFDPARNIVLDPDIIKAQLPEFKGWNAAMVHQESSFIFAEAHKIANRLRLNVVSDQTMRSFEKVERIIKSFKKAGATIEGHYMHLPRQDAALRAIARFLGKGPRERGRYVPVEAILENIENEANFQALKALFRKWSVWDNQVPEGKASIFVGGKGVTPP